MGPGLARAHQEVEAVARKYGDWYGMTVDPEAEVTVTCGATEGMIATMLALVNPGDEVIVFEPFYENYGPDTILCDASPVFVPLEPGQPLDLDRLAAAFGPKTRAIVVNTPANPSGRVLSRLPVAAAMAFASAGAGGGTAVSPSPDGGASVSAKKTSTRRGTSVILSSG